MSAVKNSGYFQACSAVVMLKIKARSVCTRMRGCTNVARPQQGIRAKKITFKLELGLNFAVNVNFSVCKDDFNKKN